MVIKLVVYKKRTSTRDPRFHARATQIGSFNDTYPLPTLNVDIIPVGDDVVLCNSCNANIYDAEKETFGWLIYLSKVDMMADRPYDFYCDQCVQRSFPKAEEVQ